MPRKFQENCCSTYWKISYRFDVISVKWQEKGSNWQPPDSFTRRVM